MRYCNFCQIKKENFDYYKNSGTCKSCKLEKIRQYRKQNPEVARKASRKWAAKVRSVRLKNDVLFNFTYRIRNLVKNAIRKNGYSKTSKTFKIVGLSKKALLEYLWQGFEKKYGLCRSAVSLKELHIDHIIPISSAKCQEDVISLNHYSNLQFLFAKDNLSKGARTE